MIWRYEPIAIKWLTQSGMIPTPYSIANHKTLKMLHAVAHECSAWIVPHLKGMTERREGVPSLIYIYPFEHDMQSTCIDGLCSTFRDNISTIGISTDVIEGNLDYLRLVMLHELAHLTHMNHSPDFVQHLDRMIYEFNKVTGRNLKNDISHEGLYLDPTGHYTHRADSQVECIT